MWMLNRKSEAAGWLQKGRRSPQPRDQFRIRRPYDSHVPVKCLDILTVSFCPSLHVVTLPLSTPSPKFFNLHLTEAFKTMEGKSPAEDSTALLITSDSVRLLHALATVCSG